MAAPAQTRIFGIKIGVDPKILAGGLIALAVLIFWYNSRSDEDVPATLASAHHDALNPVTTASPVLRPKSAVSRRANRNDADRGTLRLRAIDPTRGDVDPTLRLDLLAKLQTVQPVSGGRSLFEIGPAPLSAADQKLLAHPPVVPKVPPKPLTPVASLTPGEQPLNIPLKYYGFVRSGEKAEGNAGLFLDGDNIVVGSEGEVVMKRYLVVALTPTTARLEDTQVKKSQTLNVVPAATP
jgi:hypothetical protein